MHRALAISIVAAAAAVSGCARASGESAGPTVERDYQVANFDRIEVGGPYDVEVRTGAAPSVHASGPEKVLERMVVEVRGSNLSIHPRKDRGSWMSGWKRDQTVRIIVTVPKLVAADIAGSGGMRINQVRGESFDGQIAGSGNLSVDQIDVQRLTLGIAGSGEAKARSGRARNVQYEIAGSGDIDGRAIAAETASISIAGSGNVAGQASGTASIDIMGSGDVDLTGGAKCTVSKAGSGNVRCS